CVHDEILGLYRRWTLVHYSDTGIPLVAQAGEGGGNTSRERAKLRFIRSVIHGELAAVVIILLCAAMMACGGWI
ncbi:MAG: hypothetical protein WAN68_12805, partial [Pseudolabrys sp.]